MANTYTQLHIHLIFATQRRAVLLTSEQCKEIQRYIGGIINNRNHKLLCIKVMPDHTHLLLSLQPTTALSDLVRDIKAISSKFINDHNLVPDKFHWQEGYGAFTYAHSQLSDVVHYIENQEEHHHKATFKEEYKSFLEKFTISYEERFLFDFKE